MNTLSNLLVCGLLQVTLVAIVGLCVVAISGRWSRVSAARLSMMTLTSIVMLTVLALVPWPSWLERSEQSSAREDARRFSPPVNARRFDQCNYLRCYRQRLGI
jgi:hypothetical protein